MPLPDRPADAEDIATDWGQEIHDRVFAPKGCLVHGGTVSSNISPVNTLPIDTADDDPGGWMDAANDRLVAPPGAEGLYILYCRATSTGGSTGDSVRVLLYVNGSFVVGTVEQCVTSEQISIMLAGVHLDITAGDVILLKTQKVGTVGAAPTTGITHLSLIRIGDGYGA